VSTQSSPNGKSEIGELVQFYLDNSADYEAGGYKEARARNDLIDRFFMALDWDVRNDSRKGELDRDVVLEDTVEVEGRAKAPDYCFRVDQRPKFYVEAKKPSVGIKENSEAAYQLRRYCWSATLPGGVLTNFREFSVYDGRKPKDTDSASIGRLLYITSDDYESRWKEIVELFSPAAIRAGSLERLAESAETRKGGETVDKAFLLQLDLWRKELARVLALRNTGLSQRDLNFAVQSILDRIIFLRIAEDRDIEPYGRLKTLSKVTGVYSRLVEFFQLADARYNSCPSGIS
jgi:predicted type IV restriction endonuclease